jgi:hypothetical protein
MIAWVPVMRPIRDRDLNRPRRGMRRRNPSDLSAGLLRWLYFVLRKTQAPRRRQVPLPSAGGRRSALSGCRHYYWSPRLRHSPPPAPLQLAAPDMVASRPCRSDLATDAQWDVRTHISSPKKFDRGCAECHDRDKSGCGSILRRRAHGHARGTYARHREAVCSKMSRDEIEGQRSPLAGYRLFSYQPHHAAY